MDPLYYSRFIIGVIIIIITSYSNFAFLLQAVSRIVFEWAS